MSDSLFQKHYDRMLNEISKNNLEKCFTFGSGIHDMLQRQAFQHKRAVTLLRAVEASAAATETALGPTPCQPNRSGDSRAAGGARQRVTIADQLADFFRSHPGVVFTPSEVGRKFLKIPDSTIRPMFGRLVDSGVIVRVGRGRYTLAGNSSLQVVHQDLTNRMRKLLLDYGSMTVSRMARALCVDLTSMIFIAQAALNAELIDDATSYCDDVDENTIFEPTGEDIIADYRRRKGISR